MVVSGAVTVHVPLRAGNPDCSQVILASSLPTELGAELSWFLMEKPVCSLI